MMGVVFPEIVKLLSACAWPFVVLKIFMIFKKPIEDLISEIVCIRFKTGNKEFEVEIPQEKINKDGVDNIQNVSGENAQDDRQMPKKDDTDLLRSNKIHLSELPENYVFKNVLEEQEKSIKEDLDKSPFQPKEILIRELASYQLATEYERIYHCIFKSQFDVLQNLVKNSHGLAIEEIRAFYKKAKRKFPEAYNNWSFENWFAFLQANNFFKQQEDKYYPTIHAEAFTRYITEQQRYDIRSKSF